MAKLHAIYSVSGTEERFIGQAYLTEQDLDYIDQSFAGELKEDYFITLTDGDVVSVNMIDSVEEIEIEEEE